MILFLHVVPAKPDFPDLSHLAPELAVSLRQQASQTATTVVANGSWFAAPYLTRHGEIDPGLRQRHQLTLSQKRYDRLLRDTWLMVNATVWSAIARKLEGEVNGGGWETI